MDCTERPQTGLQLWWAAGSEAVPHIDKEGIALAAGDIQSVEDRDKRRMLNIANVRVPEIVSGPSLGGRTSVFDHKYPIPCDRRA